MDILNISSKENTNLKILRKIKHDNKYLKDNNLFIVDDYLTFLEFIKNTKQTNINYKILKIFTHSLELAEFIKNNVKDYHLDKDFKIYIIKKEILKDILKVDNIKVAALFKYNIKQNFISFENMEFNKNKLNFVIVLDNIENPGNLGTIFRNSLAFNFYNIALVNLKTYVYNTLTFRASKGSLFYLNLYFINDYPSFLDFIYKSINNISLIKNKVAFILAQNDKNSLNINQFNLISEFVKKYNLIFVVFGNEESGINNNLKKIIKDNFEYINIRIDINIDSINVACANAIFNFVFSNI